MYRANKAGGLAIAALALAAMSAGEEQPAAFKIVVNAANAETALDAAQVSGMYLKKLQRWGDGNKVLPCDQKSGSAVRETFSTAIHGRSTRYIKNYWRKLVFSGQAVPPPEVDSDDEVVAYVAKNPGAIGYVAASFEVGDTVREIELK